MSIIRLKTIKLTTLINSAKIVTKKKYIKKDLRKKMTCYSMTQIINKFTIILFYILFIFILKSHLNFYIKNSLIFIMLFRSVKKFS